MQVPCFRLTFLRWALWWWGYSEPPFCPFPDVRLRHQGALGRLAVWRRKKGLAHPLSFQSLWVSSQKCFFTSTSRWLQFAVFINTALAEAASPHTLRHQHRQMVLLQSVGVWRRSSPRGPSSNPLRLIMPLSFLGSASGWSLLSRLLPLWSLNIHFLHLQLIPFIQFLVMNSAN